MQKQIVLQAVKNETKTSKAGNQYRSCSILLVDREGKETWFNMFSTPQTESWSKGDTVLLDFYEEEYNGKMSWKCKPVSVETQLNDLKNHVATLEQQMLAMVNDLKKPTAREMVEAQGIRTVADEAFDNINREPQF